MQVELKRIQTEVGLTFIHVTHDQEEAMTMADTVAVMNRGRIEQMGPPETLYDLPETSFVANFLGQANLVLGQVQGTRDDAIEVEVAGQRILVPEARAHDRIGKVILGIRPEKVRIDATGGGADNALTGAVVRDVSFSGVSTQYLLDVPGAGSWVVFEQNLEVDRRIRAGDVVSLSWDARHTFTLRGDQDLHAGLDEEVLQVVAP
ncbi:MAG: ABC transporter ATP-binding protein, partial [Lapillicoccus sp.]